jgi:type IV pilus assembly protein PilZ
MDRAPIVFPIRFATHNAAVQTTTRELSREGVFVRCLEPPQIGTSISMRLYLPGRRDGLQVDGLVEEVAAPGREAGFWAAFRNLEPPARVEIVEVIARRERASDAKPIGAMAVQPDPEPRRAFPRYNARFAVRFSSVQEFVLEYAANISAGGLFVQTDNPPPLKTTVRVEMELPGGGPPVPAKGLVVHRVTKEDAQKRGTAAGVGLQFVDADDSFRGRIDAAIEHILKDQK